jgi:hypothetical protein
MLIFNDRRVAEWTEALCMSRRQKAVEKAGVARRRGQIKRSFKEKDAGVEKNDSRKRNSRLSSVGGWSGAGNCRLLARRIPPLLLFLLSPFGAVAAP